MGLKVRDGSPFGDLELFAGGVFLVAPVQRAVDGAAQKGLGVLYPYPYIFCDKNA